MDVDFWKTNGVSLGGITVGFAILVWFGYRWWYSPGRDWKSLVFPMVPLISYGMLLILCAGGLLGGIAGTSLWASNAVGGATLVHGVGGTSPDVTRAASLVLSPGGHMVVILMTVALMATWVFNRKVRRLDVVLFVLCGISLGLSAGVAGIAAMLLAPGVDTVGGLLLAGVQGL